MSEHKTGQSNWPQETKELYRKRRSMGLRGQLGYANVGHMIGEEFIPDGFKKPRKSKKHIAYLSRSGVGR